MLTHFSNNAPQLINTRIAPSLIPFASGFKHCCLILIHNLSFLAVRLTASLICAVAGQVSLSDVDNLSAEIMPLEAAESTASGAGIVGRELCKSKPHLGHQRSQPVPQHSRHISSSPSSYHSGSPYSCMSIQP